MSVTIINGTQIAEDIKAEVALEVSNYNLKAFNPGWPSY
jgi:hypothetical protein